MPAAAQCAPAIPVTWAPGRWRNNAATTCAACMSPESSPAHRTMRGPDATTSGARFADPLQDERREPHGGKPRFAADRRRRTLRHRAAERTQLLHQGLAAVAAHLFHLDDVRHGHAGGAAALHFGN